MRYKQFVDIAIGGEERRRRYKQFVDIAIGGGGDTNSM